MLAYLKHYSAYNVETQRFTFSNNVSTFDWFDSYLPQYKAAFTRGNASGAMCSYMCACQGAAETCVSSCGSDWLMNQLIRKEWGQSEAVVMSDCSAVGNMRKNIMNLSGEAAAARAANAAAGRGAGGAGTGRTQSYLSLFSGS